MNFQTHGTSPVLLILVLIPLVGSLVVFSLREAQAKLAKQLSLGISLITLVYTLVLLFGWDTHHKDRFQYFGSLKWIKSFGVHHAIGHDGIPVVLQFMALVLVPTDIIASWNA